LKGRNGVIYVSGVVCAAAIRMVGSVNLDG
jgi:hypothetical protein